MSAGAHPNRFELSFDFHEHMLPEFPQPIFLTHAPRVATCARENGPRFQTTTHVQRHPDPKQSRGCGAADAVPTASSNARRPPQRVQSQGVGLPRLHAPGHTNGPPLVGDPPQGFGTARDAHAARRDHQRLFAAARAEDVEGFHGVRAAAGTSTRTGHATRRANPLERGASARHGGVQGAARLPAAPKLGHRRQARTAQGPSGDARPEALLGRPTARAAPASTTPDNTMHNLRPRASSRRQIPAHGGGDGPSRPSRCAASRTALRTCTTAGCRRSRTRSSSSTW